MTKKKNVEIMIDNDGIPMIQLDTIQETTKIIIDYDKQPCIHLDLIPKDPKQAMNKIKESRKSGIDKWIHILKNPSGIWKEINDMLDNISKYLNDD